MGSELFSVAIAAVFTTLGAVITALPQALIQRRTSSSDRVFERRLEALNRLWGEYLSVRGIFDTRPGYGPSKWDDKKKIEIQNGPLERFRWEIERSKIVLDGSVIEAFREIYLHLAALLDEDDHKPSVYSSQLGVLITRLEVTINKSMRRATHRVNLSKVSGLS